MQPSQVRAALTDPRIRGHVCLGMSARGAPRDDQAVVKVEHLSLNRGELRMAASKERGQRIGWDVAGIVEQAASDGGPPVGTPVMAFVRARDGWAERVNVPIRDLAPIPKGLSSEAAASLPVAACTALGCLDRARRLPGSTALVTGVTGGVGGFGVQIARAAGAFVVAQVRRNDQVALAHGLGADRVVVTETGEGFDRHGPYDFVMDAIGGELFRRGIDHLSPDGVAVTYGMSATPSVELPLASLFGPGRVMVQGFNLYAESQVEPVGRLLTRVGRLVADARIRPDYRVRGSWQEIGPVAHDLLERQFTGKAVLTVD